MSIRRRYAVPFTMAVAFGLLLTMTFAAGAAPPGNQRFTQTWGSAGATDTFLHPTVPDVGQVPVEARIDFNTDEYGQNMWVHLELEAHWGGYLCSYDGPATWWSDDTANQIITVDIYYPDGVELDCGDGLVQATLWIYYSGFDTSKWHTNSTGSQCRGTEVLNDNASAFVYVETVDQLVMLDGDNLTSSGNYHMSDWRCHSTGTPGNPHK